MLHPILMPIIKYYNTFSVEQAIDLAYGTVKTALSDGKLEEYIYLNQYYSLSLGVEIGYLVAASENSSSDIKRLALSIIPSLQL